MLHLRSRSQSRLGRELQRALGPGSFVLDDPADLLAYSYDATGRQHLPAAVLFPAGTSSVAAAMRFAAARNLPVIPRGAGTNLSGGTVPLHGGVVIELSRLKRVLDVKPADRRAVVQPGITNLALQQHLAPMGYTFAPDPASQKVSTLGGNVAENSGGPHCLKYGVTADHIAGLTAVLADGEVVRLGYGPAPDDGLHAAAVLVGSEGTLGVFTEIVIRLEPLPPAVKTLLALYDRLEDAGRTVSAIIAARMLPATLELMDRLTMLTVEESFHLGYPTDAEGALIIEVDGLEPGLPGQVRLIQEICRANGARSVEAARDEAQRDRLWLGRRSAFGALARRSPVYSVQDATVPRDRLVEMMRAVGEISLAHGLETAIVAHAGDGNLHPLILYREATPERLASVHEANTEMLRRAVEMGGTITGEHGVGLEKLDYLPLAVGRPAHEAMRRLKLAFDPAERLNPGKAVPPVPAETGNAAGTTGPGTSDPTAGLAALVGEAALSGGTVLPWGSGSRQSWSPGPLKGALRACTEALDSPFRLDEANLTATSGAGARSRTLSAQLAAEGFWLPPLDHGWEGTVGGDVATDVATPVRSIYGGVGRWLLGAELIDGTGRVLRVGGRTMKNVAGYDLLRVLAGSRGRLGVLTSLTFRVCPLPGRDITLTCPLEGLTVVGNGDAGRALPFAGSATVLDRLTRATRPAAVVAAGGATIASGLCTGRLLVRICGLTEDVGWATDQWRRAIPALRALDPGEASQAWEAWSRPYANARGTGVLGEFGVSAETVPAAAMSLDGAVTSERAGLPLAWSLCLVSGAGIASPWVKYPSAEKVPGWAAPPSVPSPETAARAQLAAALRPHGGWVRVCTPESGWRPGPLDRRITAALDPGGVFGRLGGEPE